MQQDLMIFLFEEFKLCTPDGSRHLIKRSVMSCHSYSGTEQRHTIDKRPEKCEEKFVDHMSTYDCGIILVCQLNINIRRKRVNLYHPCIALLQAFQLDLHHTAEKILWLWCSLTEDTKLILQSKLHYKYHNAESPKLCFLLFC
jgi:hypothetical protein